MKNEDIIQFEKYMLRPSHYRKYKLKRQYKCVLKQADVTARAADDADEGRGRKGGTVGLLTVQNVKERNPNLISRAYTKFWVAFPQSKSL